MEKEKTIIFYGKNWTPLSKDCYGCYHFGTICAGSVYEGECRGGILEDEKPSLVANLLVNYVQNRFILARSFGYDIQSMIDEGEFKDKELLEEYQQAISTPDEVIEEYKKMYSLEQFSEVPVYYHNLNQQQHTQNNPDNTFIEEDPFSQEGPIEVLDDELPF